MRCLSVCCGGCCSRADADEDFAALEAQEAEEAAALQVLIFDFLICRSGLAITMPIFLSARLSLRAPSCHSHKALNTPRRHLIGFFVSVYGYYSDDINLL